MHWSQLFVPSSSTLACCKYFNALKREMDCKLDFRSNHKNEEVNFALCSGVFIWPNYPFVPSSSFLSGNWILSHRLCRTSHRRLSHRPQSSCGIHQPYPFFLHTEISNGLRFTACGHKHSFAFRSSCFLVFPFCVLHVSGFKNTSRDISQSSTVLLNLGPYIAD